MTIGLRPPRLRRFDRGTLRAAGFVALLTVVFLVTNTAVAAAADGTADGGSGLLAPLNVRTAEGGCWRATNWRAARRRTARSRPCQMSSARRRS